MFFVQHARRCNERIVRTFKLKSVSKEFDNKVCIIQEPFKTSIFSWKPKHTELPQVYIHHFPSKIEVILHSRDVLCYEPHSSTYYANSNWIFWENDQLTMLPKYWIFSRTSKNIYKRNKNDGEEESVCM